jgi:signal transduction histidine kinase
VMPPPALPELWADPRRLQQILWNLVHNAVKFTAKAGHVQIEVASTEEFVEILVRDTGQGISPDFLPYVFDRFRQGDQSPTKGSSGLGIGLSIAKHLAELHGGSVAAASDGAGHGATFVLQLPVRVPSGHADAGAPPSDPNHNEGLGDRPTPATRQIQADLSPSPGTPN